MQNPDEATVERIAHPGREADLAIADECRLNVLWWHDAAKGGRALEIQVPTLSLARGLTSLFDEVVQLPLRALGGPGESPALPLADESFGLVTLYGHGPTRAVLAELRRVLKPGGTLLLAAANRWWNGRLRQAGAAATGRPVDLHMANTLRRVGFDQVFPYWLEPSLAIPRTIIPAAPGRAPQFEAIRARESGAGRAHSFAVHAGLAALLYPGMLFVAKRTASVAQVRA